MASAMSIRSAPRSSVTLNEPDMGRLSGTQDAEGVETDADGLSIEQLEAFLTEVKDEPRWRKGADKCADFYDGNQLTNEVLAEMAEEGIPPLIINMVQPTINTVLGMEAKTRTDWHVDYEDEQFEDVATALNKKLIEAERETRADSAISDAYAGQIKAGLGWVEVTRNPNPFLYRYRVKSVHRREVWWDWRKRDPEDWRYLVRKRWFDADELIFAFPKFKDLIRYSLSKWGNWNVFAERLDQKTGLGQAFDIERAFTLEEQDWRDSERDRACAFEVWYRKWVRGFVARLENGQVIELDVEKNIRHAQAVATGAVKPFMAVYPKVRQAIYIGPHRVLDRPSPLPHRKFPYIPFFGFREDLTGCPYGLIRSMLSPQEEINARRSRLLSLMSSRRVQFDNDALDLSVNTVQDVVDEVSRHNSVFVTNPKRLNRGTKAIVIEDNRDMASQQFEVLQESKDNIAGVSGVYPPMSGDNRGVPSGVALSGLIDQGTQTLAEINDNYTFSRRDVGDQVMEFVKADNLHPHTMTVGEGRAKKEIQLNVSAFDDQLGEVTTANDVATAQVKVVLEDVPSTPAWRQQESAQLSEVAKSLPPEAQAFVVPFYLESTNIRNRKKIAQLLRKQMGIPEEGADDVQDPRLAQLQQEHEQAVGDLTAQLQATAQENQQLKAGHAIKEHEVQVKAASSAAKAQTDQHRADTERLKVVAPAVGAEAVPGAPGAPAKPAAAAMDARAIVKEVTQALEPALEEMTETVRELARSFEDRLGAMEKSGKETPAAATAGAAPPAPQPLQMGPFNIQQPAPAPKPVRKTITMQTPMGPVTATIEPEGVDGPEPKKPAADSGEEKT